MRWVEGLGIALVMVSMASGCGERAPAGPEVASADAAKAPARPARADGLVLVDDRQEPVAPFVMHDPHLDLFVRCQMKRDGAKKEGRTVPLCFDATRRQTDGLKVLRVERAPGDLGAVLRRLAASDEGAHFVVERTGTLHQVLDLAYTARRDGALRPDEVRVVTCHESAWQKLADALKALFPGLRVEVTDLPAPPDAPRAPAAETAPGGTPQ